MDKQPLYSIDSLFQQKLEELPVDASQQHEQWLSLTKTLHKGSKGWQSQLQTPLAKVVYMTVVALVPFAVFYLLHQQPDAESQGLPYTGNSVSRSLMLLNKVSRPTPTQKTTIEEQMPGAMPSAKPIVAEALPIPQPAENEVKAIASQPEKGKDSVRTAPVKQEKPATKKGDSTYIYWQ